MGNINYKRNRIVFLIIVLIGIGIFGAVQWSNLKAKAEIWNSLDAARKEYKKEIESASIYENREGDYVKDVKVKDVFVDNDLSYCAFHKNLDKVTITIDDSIEDLKIRQRCEIFIGIKDEINGELDERFEDSSYYKIYRDNMGYTSMEYRELDLNVSHGSEFEFITSKNKYSFCYSFSMTVTDKKTGENNYYDYYDKDGKIISFKNRYKSGNSYSDSGSASTNSGTGHSATSGKSNYSSSSGKSNYSSSGKSSYSSSGKSSYSSSSGRKRYDYYDVDEYDSAQDFADDKYEEFYDYEDDYEDEDEAYDAAEDYWNENH